MSLIKANRLSIQLVLVLVSFVLSWIAFSDLVVVPLIERAYHGESLPIFNNIISGQAVHPVQYYIAQWETLTRNVLLVLITAGLIPLVATRPEVQRYVGTRQGRQTVLTTSLVTLSCVVVVSLFSYLVFLDPVIESVYRGESFKFLNKLIQNHDLPLEHYVKRGRLIFSRILLLWIATQLILTASVLHQQTLRVIREFFAAETHPINLAVFRVVVFGVLLISVDTTRIVWFSQIPAELQVAPAGLGWLPAHLPFTTALATASSTLLLLFSLMGMIGFFTRTSALLCAIVGFYALGIPQFFGKVDHYHFLLWFPAILAVSRSGDVFSIDAIFSAWKRADRGITDPPGPSQTYALPLRFVWLLIGIIYFFPGFWKWWAIGLDWALSDNLKFQMYSHWLELGGWTPVFRIDRYPFLYRLAGLGTIVLEISFVCLIWFPKLRRLAVLGALAFHNSAWLWMKIGFWRLQFCYVAFFDWNAIFRGIGHWLYREEMYVAYDGSCQICRRTIASLRTPDIFGRVTYVNAFDEPESSALAADMQASVGKKNWPGFAAYRALATRIPLLWPFLPLLYVWPIPTIGNRVYRHVADSRACGIPTRTSTKTAGSKLRPQLRAVIAVGALLLAANIFCGIGKLITSWPFACFPTFAFLTGAERESIGMSVLDAEGEVIPFDPRALPRAMSSGRFAGLVRNVLKTKSSAELQSRLEALFLLFAQNDLRLQHADTVRFYSMTLLTSPEEQRENPVDQELLYELKR